MAVITIGSSFDHFSDTAESWYSTGAVPVTHIELLYSRKYSWGPNFVLFVLSLSERNLTHETYVMMDVFSCVKWTERKLNTRI